VLVDKMVQRFGEDLTGRTFAVWGLAFKPNTDDMREAPSRVVIIELLARGATCAPTTRWRWTEAQRVLGTPGLRFVDRQDDALEGADALLVVTEWKEFDAEGSERRTRVQGTDVLTGADAAFQRAQRVLDHVAIVALGLGEGGGGGAEGRGGDGNRGSNERQFHEIPLWVKGPARPPSRFSRRLVRRVTAW
jgi:hypothetical protein